MQFFSSVVEKIILHIVYMCFHVKYVAAFRIYEGVPLYGELHILGSMSSGTLRTS